MRLNATSDVPIGAVVVQDGEVIARGAQPARGRRRPDGPRRDPGAARRGPRAGRVAPGRLHALRDARALLHVRGRGCVNARVERIVYGAPDPKAGAVGSLADVPADVRLNHRPRGHGRRSGRGGGALLQAFFAAGPALLTGPAGGSTVCRLPRPRAERCRSGRTGRFRKPVYAQGYPGFESLPLRHFSASAVDVLNSHVRATIDFSRRTGVRLQRGGAAGSLAIVVLAPGRHIRHASMLSRRHVQSPATHRDRSVASASSTGIQKRSRAVPASSRVLQGMS